MCGDLAKAPLWVSNHGFFLMLPTFNSDLISSWKEAKAMPVSAT